MQPSISSLEVKRSRLEIWSILFTAVRDGGEREEEIDVVVITESAASLQKPSSVTALVSQREQRLCSGEFKNTQPKHLKDLKNILNSLGPSLEALTQPAWEQLF